MNKSANNLMFELLAKKLAAQASPLEIELLNKLLENSALASEDVMQLEQLWGQKVFGQGNSEIVGQKEAADKIWQKAFEQKPKKNLSRINLSFFLRLAATLLILVSLVFASRKLTYKEAAEAPRISTITKETLPGQKSTITLSDGTVVWLNAGSKISFASNYNDSIREIHLSGQAYFEVFKDAAKPFRVYCRDIMVEALGTSFDVNGYTDLPLQVSLVTGSVKVSSNESGNQNHKEIVLKPGEYSRFNKDDKFESQGRFDEEYNLAWKNGKIIFRNANINVIIARLELWYGVSIQNQADLPANKPFTGVFEKENLENILMNIGAVMEFDYEIKGNNVVLKNTMPM